MSSSSRKEAALAELNYAKRRYEDSLNELSQLEKRLQNKREKSISSIEELLTNITQMQGVVPHAISNTIWEMNRSLEYIRSVDLGAYASAHETGLRFGYLVAAPSIFGRLFGPSDKEIAEEAESETRRIENKEYDLRKSKRLLLDRLDDVTEYLSGLNQAIIQVGPLTKLGTNWQSLTSREIESISRAIDVAKSLLKVVSEKDNF